MTDVPHNRILAQVMSGITESPTDTPDAAAFRRRAVVEYARLQATGQTFDLKGDFLEWDDEPQQQKETDR
jgi:hypothetical protein